jgi:hypothetical protein
VRRSARAAATAKLFDHQLRGEEIPRLVEGVLETRSTIEESAST